MNDSIEQSASVEGYGTRFIRLTVTSAVITPTNNPWDGPHKSVSSMTVQLTTEQIKALMDECHLILQKQDKE